MHEAAHGVLDAGSSYAKGDLRGVLTAGVTIIKELTNTPERREIYRRTMTSPADVIQLSGCKDYQTSADTMEGVSIPQTLTFVVFLSCGRDGLMIGTTNWGDELGLSAGSSDATTAELQVFVVQFEGVVGSAI